MASNRAKLLMSLIRTLRTGGANHEPEQRPKQLKRARLFVRLMTTPHPPKTRTIPVNASGFKAEWHVGPTYRDDARIVYFHGGGYAVCSPKTHRHFSAMLAKETGMAVLSVDYRLAPEHPFPAAQDDAMNAYEWARENGPDGHSPVSCLFVGGDSAGGGLSVSAVMRLRDEGRVLPNAVFLVSPWLDLTLSSDSVRRLKDVDVVVDADYTQRWVEYYAGENDLRKPGISPVFGDFSGLPPMYFTVSGREIFLDDTLTAIVRSKEADVETTLDRGEEMFHGWPLFFHLIPEGRASLDKLVRFLDAQRIRALER